MGASEQARALIWREATEGCLQLLCLSFQTDPSQFSNEFDDFSGRLLIRRLILNPACKLTSLHADSPGSRFALLTSSSRAVIRVQVSEPVRLATILPI